MPPALLAVLPLAHRRLLKHANVLGPGRDLYGVWLPEGKSIDRSTRPRTARSAMTVAHCFRFPGDFQSNSTAKTLSRIFCHYCLSFALASTCRLMEILIPGRKLHPRQKCGKTPRTVQVHHRL